MKLVLSLTACILACGVNAQLAITEICSSQNMNGVMVGAVQYNDTIYSTGFFTQICGDAANHVAKWNGSDWDAAGFNLPHDGNALRTIGNDLYAVTYVDNPSDSNWLYRYDGTNLTTIGAGTYLTTATNFSNLNNIYDVVEYNGEIYICGEFDRVGSQQISGIARWDGNSWSDVGGGLSGNIQGAAPLMFPHKLEVIDGVLYCAGNFQFAGGVEVNGIAAWNGSSWSAMGSGFNSTVYAVESFDNELYVGGAFTESNGVTLNRIAKWDGVNWSSPGFGFTDVNPFFIFVHTLYNPNNNGLFVAGGLKEVAFDTSPTESCGGLIFYNGVFVETYSGGVSGNDIEAVIIDDTGQMLVGGGVFGSGYVGIVQDVTHLEEIEGRIIKVTPNPVADNFSIESDLSFESIQVVDISGRLIDEVVAGIEIDATRWDSGAYFIRAHHNGVTYSKKIIKQ